jgi:hypothetical protein
MDRISIGEEEESEANPKATPVHEFFIFQVQQKVEF